MPPKPLWEKRKVKQIVLQSYNAFSGQKRELEGLKTHIEYVV